MNAPTLDETIAALADPTRRAVIDLLRDGPHRAGEIAAALDMSAPALSRHLRLLRQSGLITDDAVEEDARVRLFRLEPLAFASLRDWMAELESYWSGQLNAFKQHAEATGKRPTRKTK